jgi:ankyrin repeat protein
LPIFGGFNLGPVHLHTKVEDTCTEIATALLSSGADPNIPEERTLKTPLHFAACHGSVKMVEKLLQYGADASKTDLSGANPLQEALAAVKQGRSESNLPRYRDIICILKEAGGSNGCHG